MQLDDLRQEGLRHLLRHDDAIRWHISDPRPIRGETEIHDAPIAQKGIGINAWSQRLRLALGERVSHGRGARQESGAAWVREHALIQKSESVKG